MLPPPTSSAAPPLSHHEVLALVEPFARSGRRLDLAATQRAERRLVFQPVQRPLGLPDSARGLPELQEVLVLEVYPRGALRLTRTLTHPQGLHASLQASGAAAETLLARVDAVAPALHFSSGMGYTLSRSYVLPTDGRAGAAPVLCGGEVRLDGLRLTMTVPATRGVSADLQLRAEPQPLALPQDLLAVLGWNWARLITTPLGWKTRLRLRGSPQRRTAAAEQALARAAVHLARVLAEPPAAFHDRLLRARWGVVFRRALPALTPLVLVATIVLMPRIDTGPYPGLWLLLYHLPTLLVVLSFSVQELPQLEIPPWPRRSAAPDWRLPPAAPVHAGPSKRQRAAGAPPGPDAT